MQILIVDDDEIARELLSHALKQAGYRVRVAPDGREALAILRSMPFRIVISDWIMPEMDGIELCRQIRAGDFPHYIYMILLTSRGRTEDIVEGLGAGADDFITKPFDPAELCVRVRAGERILSLETRELAIFAMAKLVESRDWETGAHLERMRRYARVLAEHLLGWPEFHKQMDADYVRLIYLTSPLHDIGKIGIPDAVLLKPTRLNDTEFEIMKRHTVIGAQTLEAALREHPEARFLSMARDIALTHHENFDGSGYPNGLAGDDIPLCGRIVALADVYDALTTKRVYKDAYSHEVAKSMILEEAGRHFDPRMVDAFIATEEQLRAIQQQFSEDQPLVADGGIPERGLVTEARIKNGRGGESLSPVRRGADNKRLEF
jgi:putative two-component system response regulator